MNLPTKSARQWQRLRVWGRKPSPARLPFPRTVISSSRHLPRRVSRAAAKPRFEKQRFLLSKAVFQCVLCRGAIARRYDRLKEKCQPFLQALEHFPKLVEVFVEKVKELFSIKEAQERKEREDRAAARKEQSKHRRGRNDWER